MATLSRQPFGEISAPRLQALGSSKNRQNSLSSITSQFACPLKPSATASIGKRQREPEPEPEPEIFEDDDCENADPAAHGSPPKKSRTSSDVVVKPARFSMAAPSPARSCASLTDSPASSAPCARKSVSSPSTARSTPISHSRGSPKNKRLSALSKRRTSGSFRRVDPPSFSQSALPFSIDAALSGTITNYTPRKAAPAAPAAPPAPVAPQQVAAAIEESMPNSWFFEIYEDTPEQEAANMMQHSASVLDISSEDDAATKAFNDELEKGKENIPPPDFALAQPQTTSSASIDDGEETEIEPDISEPIKRGRRLRTKIAQDAMDEDRTPLGDLPPSNFYAKGCDAGSYVTVDVGIERPSRLSKEIGVGPSEHAELTKKQQRAREPERDEGTALLEEEESSTCTTSYAVKAASW
ncbi:hypothetical protein G6514_004272 [Epicoccum nigrum]|nr:hypothetical protein G6514_004272 [Epicoccum nigrum]